MKRFVFRAGYMACIGITVFLLFLYISIQPVTVKTTLGTVAEKQADFEGCRLILANAIHGERSGPFIRFKSAVDHRYDVVLTLREDAPDDCTVFRCYCVGIMNDRIAGCPFEPPFVLLIHGEPTDP